MIAGVAGKYCSGKSTVTRLLVAKGFLEINLDTLGHIALKESAVQVVEQFGEAVSDNAGGIDRKKLGSIVFKNPGQRRLLEGILHPKMVEMVEAFLASHTGENIVIDGALLFYMGIGELCDIAFWVHASFIKRFFRASKRDKLPLITLLQRFGSQRYLTPQPSSNDVDIYYIRNNGSPAVLKERIGRILP